MRDGLGHRYMGYCVISSHRDLTPGSFCGTLALQPLVHAAQTPPPCLLLLHSSGASQPVSECVLEWQTSLGKSPKTKKKSKTSETSGVIRTSTARQLSPAPWFRTVPSSPSVECGLKSSRSYISCMNTTVWSDTAADFTSQGGTLLWTSVSVCLCG